MLLPGGRSWAAVSRPLAVAYLCTWALATALALVMVGRAPREYELFSRAYVRCLLVPWKLISFALAAGFFVFAAPYTGDPTWDRTDGAMMSVLTYLTAPWSLGTLVRAVRRRVPRRRIYVAVVAWLFSASWSYDGYLFLRDGLYPATWWSNLLASSTLYLSAGMMWSLTHVPGRGMVFDFMTDEWLGAPRARFGRVGLAVVFVMLAVAVPLWPFVVEIWHRSR